MSRYDLVVVGGGIVGLTLARALKRRRPQARMLVLEKEAEPGRHASGRNSGVIHSGIYYAPGTLKARLCAAGAARMRAFADEQGVAWRPSGKVILATRAEEVPAIDRLLANAAACGIRAERLDERGVRAVEPHAGPSLAALHVPDTAVIDAPAAVRRLAELLRADGVELRCRARVTAIDARAAELRLGAERIGFGYLCNCAGAYADVLARAMGCGAGYALVPFRGSFARVAGASAALVRGNVYPVPDLALPFLGVHLTRSAGGEVFAGPTAFPALGREHYGGAAGLRWREALDAAGRIARLYLRNHQGFRRLVHAEARLMVPRALLAAARRLVPGLRPEDMVAGAKSGIRPQLVDLKASALVLDFVVQRTPVSLHVLNAISPAFTCAFAFAEWLADRIEEPAGASA